MEDFWSVTSNTNLRPPSTPEACGIASALFEECIPGVRAPSSLSLLPCHRPQCHTAPGHGPSHRCWVKHCSRSKEANSALRTRCVAQANLEVSVRQATIPVRTETAAREVIAGYTPPTTAGIKKWERSFHWEANNSSAAFPNNFLFLIKRAISQPSWVWFLCQIPEPWVTEVHFLLVDAQGKQYSRMGVWEIINTTRKCLMQFTHFQNDNYSV